MFSNVGRNFILLKAIFELTNLVLGVWALWVLSSFSMAMVWLVINVVAYVIAYRIVVEEVPDDVDNGET